MANIFFFQSANKKIAELGGEGSGNYNHAGRHGEVGGSASSWEGKVNSYKEKNIEIAKKAPKTTAPEKLQKYIDEAYSLGEKARLSGYSNVKDGYLYYDANFEDIMNYDKPEMVSFEAGLKGNKKPHWVNGWRYGKIPESGYSTNFAESKLELGVSVMATDNGLSTPDPSFEMFGGSKGNKDKIYISGFLNTNNTGGDGEPLLLWAKKTGDVIE